VAREVKIRNRIERRTSPRRSRPLVRYRARTQEACREPKKIQDNVSITVGRDSCRALIFPRKSSQDSKSEQRWEAQQNCAGSLALPKRATRPHRHNPYVLGHLFGRGEFLRALQYFKAEFRAWQKSQRSRRSSTLPNLRKRRATRIPLSGGANSCETQIFPGLAEKPEVSRELRRNSTLPNNRTRNQQFQPNSQSQPKGSKR
jgi:hypothetical protein